MSHQIFRVRTGTLGSLFLMAAPPASSLEQRIAICGSLGVARIVSLLGANEASQLGLGGEADACAKQEIAFEHFPITDFDIPELQPFKRLVEAIADDLRQGSSVALHCRAGIGRTGTTACCVLQALGTEPDAAIEIVSTARRASVPESPSQIDFVRSFGRL